MIGIQLDVGEQALVLRCRILRKESRQRTQLADEELEIDLQVVTDSRAVSPRLGLRNSLDLFLHPHRAVAEKAAEADEAVDLVDVERFPVGDLPKSSDIEREPGIVPVHPASVHPQLTQVEQHAVVEMALVDVGADLPLVVVQILQRALRVEHEAVSNEVDRREIRLQAAAAELREVRVRRKA
jgi:hypothetical protein